MLENRLFVFLEEVFEADGAGVGWDGGEALVLPDLREDGESRGGRFGGRGRGGRAGIGGVIEVFVHEIVGAAHEGERFHCYFAA